jgi:DNA polymerase I-like protein with 3'-5' exonuclease and polymerase domains
MSRFAHIAARYIAPAGARATAGLRLVFDVESDGLLNSATRIHCIVVADLDGDRVDAYGPEQIPAALEHLKRATYLCGHNIIGYDLPLLHRLHDWASASDRVVDTLIAGRLILPHLSELDDKAAAMGDLALGKLRGRYGLEAWGLRLGIAKTGTDIEDWSQWTPEMQQRCVGDVAIGKALWRFLQPDGYSRQAMELEHRVAPICDQITAAGVPFDVEAAERLHEQWTKRRSEIEATLRQQFPGANFNSRAQVGALLEARGWIPEKRTEKTKQPKIDGEVLESLPALYPEFTGLAEHQIIGRRLGQLADGKEAWLKHVGVDGRIHGSIVHIGTPHSRAAHFNPNLSQVPNPKRGKPLADECRALFRHPGDWVFVACDQAGLQDRCFSHYLAEFDGGDYGRSFVAGADPHWAAATALELVARDTKRDKASKLHSVLREGGKSFRYGFLFGMRAKRAGEIIAATIRAARQVEASYRGPLANGGQTLRRFVAATPGLKQLRESLEAQAARKGWVSGLDGRRVPIDAQYKSLNRIVTSAEAIICKRWLIRVHDELRQRFRYGWDGDVVIVAWIHDELVCCCRPEIADEVGEIMVRHAKEPGEFYALRVPLDADYKIGRSWAGEEIESAPVDAPSIIRAPIPEDEPPTAAPVPPSNELDADTPRRMTQAELDEINAGLKREGIEPLPESIMVLADEACAFLADMFATSAAPIYLSSLANPEDKHREGPEEQVRTREPAGIRAFLKRDRPRRALYFCTATVKTGKPRALENLQELIGLHTDIDAKDIVISLTEVEQALRQLELPPSAVVVSGRGLHAYWFFQECLPATAENRARHKSLLQLLANHLGGDRQCAESSRLMRTCRRGRRRPRRRAPWWIPAAARCLHASSRH